MSNHVRIALTIATCSLMAHPALGQSNAGGGVLDTLQTCRAIADDAERLACYDTTLSDAERIASEQVERERTRSREDFGLSSTQISRQEEDLAEIDPEQAAALRSEREISEPTQIAATVLEIFSDRRSGKRLFILDNGQIWRETVVSRMKRNPKEGRAVTISRSSFGGFRLRAEGARGFVNVRRVK